MERGAFPAEEVAVTLFRWPDKTLAGMDAGTVDRHPDPRQLAKDLRSVVLAGENPASIEWKGRMTADVSIEIIMQSVCMDKCAPAITEAFRRDRGFRRRVANGTTRKPVRGGFDLRLLRRAEAMERMVSALERGDILAALDCAMDVGRLGEPWSVQSKGGGSKRGAGRKKKLTDKAIVEQFHAIRKQWPLLSVAGVCAKMGIGRSTVAAARKAENDNAKGVP
jgi:hypothetical protein